MMEAVAEKYKMTEVGLIPSDWEVKTLGEVLTIRHGKDQKEVQSESGIYPIFGTGGLMGFSNKFLYNKESVLIGRKGTIDKPKYINTPFWTVDTLFYSEIESGYATKFIYYVFLMIDWYSYNEASGVPSLNARTIENIEIPFPAFEEQTRIATILSDADALISSLEKLIAKKRNLKQGAMQKLLQPKEDWEVKKLGEICEIRKGKQLNRSTLSNSESYPVMNGGISSSGYTSNYNQLANTIIISEGGNSCGFVNYITTKFWQGGHCYSLETKDSKEFIYHLLKFNEINIMALRVGSGLPNIQKNRLESFLLNLPSHNEQIRIATILSDMDNEITALESQLEKYQKIKLGMMQNLLTGKIRLV